MASPRPQVGGRGSADVAKYKLAVRRLAEGGGGEKPKNPQAVLGGLRELCLLPHHCGAADLAGPLFSLLRCERRDTQPLMLLVAWLALSNGGLPRQSFEQFSSAAQSALSVDIPEVRRTACTVIGMLNMLQYQHHELALMLHPQFTKTLLSDLDRALDMRSREKRGLTTKVSVYHEEKKARIQAHMAAISLLGRLLATHVYPVLGGNLAPVVRTLCRTAIEYSYKEKEVPVVRECLSCLAQAAGLGGVGEAVAHLPLERRQDQCFADPKALMAGPPERGAKRERKGKEMGAFPLWDPLAASALARVCLTTLQTLPLGAVFASPFYQTLLLLIHHKDKCVFSEVVFGIVRRRVLFHVLLRPDELYRSRDARRQDTLLDYVVDTRVKSMVMGTAHVECHAGLRLAEALCEQALDAARGAGAGEVLQMTRSSFSRFEDAVDSCRSRFSFDPLVTTQALKTRVWLTAVLLAQGAEQGALLVRRLLNELVSAVAISPGTTANHTDILQSMVRALKALPPGCVRALLSRAFIGLVSFLAARYVQKLSVTKFQSVLQDFLLDCDVVAVPARDRDAAPQPRSQGVKGVLDIDEVSHQRVNGGLDTLELVLCLLDGSLTSEAVNAEQAAARLLSGNADDPRALQARATQLNLELVRFVGDFANVIACGGAADAPGDPHARAHSNMLLIVQRLKAMVYSQPRHFAWEVGLAMLRIATRSSTPVRVNVYAALAELAEARSDCAQVLAPLIDIVDELMGLLAFFENLQAEHDDGGIGVDTDMLASRFYETHDNLRERIAVHVLLSDKSSFKLLGERSRTALERGKALWQRTQRAGAEAPQARQLDDLLL